MQDLAIRRATSTDGPAMAHVGRHLGYRGPATADPERLTAILNKADHAVFVAELPAQPLIGWVHVFASLRVMSEPFAEVGGLVVAEAMRHRGVGRALVRAAEDWARRQGFQRIRIRVNTHRAEAHRFYERLRYSRVKDQRVYECALNERE